MINEKVLLTDEVIDNMSRESLIKCLNISKKLMITLESIQSDYESINSKIKKVEEKRDSIKSGSILGIFISIIFCIICIGVAFAGIGDKNFWQAALGIVLLIIGVRLVKKLWDIHESKEEERKLDAEKYFNQEYPPLEQKKLIIEKQMNEIIESVEFKNARILIPYDYFDPDSVDALIRILENRRAKNLSDAINMFELDLHNSRLEEAAFRSAEAAEKQAAHSADIARNTASTARATKINAFINFMK